MMPVLDERIIAAYFFCPRKSFLLLRHLAEGSSLPSAHEYMEIFEAKAKKVKDEYIEALREVAHGDDAASTATLEDGKPFLVDAAIDADPLRVVAPLLRKVRTTSKLGRYSYETVLFVGTNKIQKEQVATLGFMGQVLGQRQGLLPKTGFIVNGNRKAHRITLRRPDKAILAAIDATKGWLLDSNSIPPRVLLNKHCTVCQFHSDCDARAKEADDLSLISSLSKKEILDFHKKGVLTIAQLSCLYRPRRRRRDAEASGRPEKHLPALKALAIRDNQIYVKDPPPLPRKNVEVFLDVEGLPDDDFYYLIGLRICDGSAVTSYSFWADTPADEPKIWESFVSKLRELDDYSLFHYGGYEPVFLRRMIKKHGFLKDKEAEILLSKLVNVLEYCYQHIYFPTHSNGLKAVAGYLGFRWTRSTVSGLQTILWRKKWEEGRDSAFRQELVEYNRQDCEALSILTIALREIIEHGQSDGQAVVTAEDVKAASPYGLGKSKFAFPEFDYINSCAYFDYQRTKIYWRTDKNIKKRRRLRGWSGKTKHRRTRINVVIRSSARVCPACKSRAITVKPGHESHKLIYDLRFGPSGVKAWLEKHVGIRYRCADCEMSFLPRSHPKGRNKYGHGLLAWIVYNKIALRQTHESIRLGLNELFGFGFEYNIVFKMKSRAVEYYRRAYNDIVRRIRTGHLVQVDETRVNTMDGAGYVWAFTTIDEVLYVYSKQRESKILTEILGEFRGVMVSDFYPAFDSFPCAQQRCLVHLIRDLNDDAFRNPFDSEFKEFVGDLGRLLKPIMETIDQYGLKRRFLEKHGKDVRRFFRRRIESECKSELVQRYQDRFKRNENRLFTFLEHDGIPWNNNNAENAIKGFAATRRGVEGTFTEAGLRETLQLLSIARTLRNKEKSFLGFLKSGKRSLWEFCGETV